MNEDLEFKLDPATHVYTRGPQRLLSVTEVLKDNGFIETEFMTEEGRARGRAVHHGLALFNAGRLKWDEKAERMRGYIESWRKLRATLRPVPALLDIEVAAYHPQWAYAGTRDLRLQVGAQEVVADFKTGEMPRWAQYQLAAYDHLLPARKHRLHWGIKVHADGALATITEFNQDRYAFEKFLAFLTTTRERVALGVSSIDLSTPSTNDKENIEHGD